jgi:hypothetical protein
MGHSPASVKWPGSDRCGTDGTGGRYRHYVTEREHSERAAEPLANILGAVGELVAAFQGWVDRHAEEIDATIRWVKEHQREIEAFGTWGAVRRACEETSLYAPPAQVWRTIAEAARRGDDAASLNALILSSYGPSGEAHRALCEELRSAPLLQDRSREIDEVLASLEASRYYVTICGALPLIEGVLASAHGKWQKHLDAYPLSKRLHESGALSADQEVELILHASAIDMVFGGIRTTWKSGGHRQVGAVLADLNRHRALHGTARGWDTVDNATYALLLLAAAARIAGPLLQPNASATSSST